MNLGDLRTSYRKHKMLSHAYGIEGNYGRVFEELEGFFKEELKESLAGNPDAYVHELALLSVEDAREVQSFASTKSVGGGRKFIVLSFSEATRQAQNALLKTIEEPHEGVHFFIITPVFDALLPTLKSRLFKIEGGKSGEYAELAKTFLGTRSAKRMALLKHILEEKKRDEALAFVSELEVSLRGLGNTFDAQKAESLERVETALRNLRLQGASLKMILEHLALTIPVSK